MAIRWNCSTHVCWIDVFNTDFKIFLTAMIFNFVQQKYSNILEKRIIHFRLNEIKLNLYTPALIFPEGSKPV